MTTTLTNTAIEQWLVERLGEDVPTLVGIDHGFSFPLRYFEVYGLSPDWPTFLDDFQRHWPTDEDHTYVYFVRDGTAGNGAARERQPAREKRRLLNFVLSNCTWEDGEVVATFRQPFDLLAETTAVAARSSAGSGGNSSKNEIWLGRQDSNLRMAVPKTAALPLGDAPTVRAN